MTCWPSWHARFTDPALRVTVSSGCYLDGSGNIPCDPETMRAGAERKLGRPVSLAAYTLSRNMTSEVGTGTPEEQVAVGEAAVNQGRLHGVDVNSVLLYRTRGASSYGRYGEIQSGTSGRWAATSKDPTVLSLLLADLILSGGSGNFNKGASDQDGMEYASAFADPEATVRRYAASGMYWVGPLPGVNPWRTTQWVKTADPTGALLARGLAFARARTKSGSRWVASPAIADPDCTSLGWPSPIALAVIAGAVLLGSAIWLGRRAGAPLTLQG